MFNTLTSLIVALAVLFGGAGATAYAAQDSMPNEFLYPIKTLTEDVQLNLEQDPQTDFDLLGGYVQRRFDEYNTMTSDGEQLSPEWATRLEQQFRLMLQLAAGMEGAQAEQAQIRIQTMLAAQERVMATLQLAEPDPVGVQIQKRNQDRLQNATHGTDGEPMLLIDPTSTSDETQVDPTSNNSGTVTGPGPGGETINGTGPITHTLPVTPTRYYGEDAPGIGEPAQEPLPQNSAQHGPGPEAGEPAQTPIGGSGTITDTTPTTPTQGSGSQNGPGAGSDSGSGSGPGR